MRLLLAMATVLMLSSLGLAAHETPQLGPYTASFDMNTDLKYQVQVENPINLSAGTIYGMLVSTDNTTRAQIIISESKNLTDSTMGMVAKLTQYDLALTGGLNTTSINRISIDSKDGIILSAIPFPGNKLFPSGTQVFKAIYWLDSKNCECGPVSVGTTNVDITSTYPQDVTKGLLESLHIAKGQAPAKK